MENFAYTFVVEKIKNDDGDKEDYNEKENMLIHVSPPPPGKSQFGGHVCPLSSLPPSLFLGFLVGGGKGVFVAVGVGVKVGVLVKVVVAVKVGVNVNVFVAVGVLVRVAVFVKVGVAVRKTPPRFCESARA